MKTFFIAFLFVVSANASDFRETFKSVLAHSNLSQNADDVVYGIPANLNQDIHAASVESFLSQINAVYNNTNPAQLFQEGQKLSKTAQSVPYQNVLGQLRKNPITVVVVPGIFGEFITTPAFEEIFANKNSSFAKTWNKKFENQGVCTNPNIDTCDETFSLKKVDSDVDANFSFSIPALKKAVPEAFQAVSLKDLFLVSSIDDTDGRPLVKVILFNTPSLSLESLSSIQDVAQVFNRRLYKLTSILDSTDTKNLVYLGYSRGTPVGLEMLYQAQLTYAPWLDNVRAFISMGGVVYGSDLADDIYVPTSASHIQLSAVEQLVNSLKYTTESSGSFFCNSRCENGKAYFSFTKALSGTMGLKDLWANLSSKSGTDTKASMGLVMKLGSDFGLLAQDGGVWANAKNLVSSEYDLNISRFRIFVKSLLVAAPQLSTKDRLEWWKSHTIPSNIHYYAVSGTLVDPQANAEDANLAPTQFASGPFEGEDYKMLLQNYKQFIRTSGAQLNDSQMSVQKVRFWPELNTLLNPKQRPIQATFLGTLGAHHWALALAVVNANKDGSKNPFPRTELLESLAATVAQDLNQ